MPDKQQFWVIKYEDAEVGDEVFVGDTAEADARDVYARRQDSWNCYLFGPVERIDALEAANKRLRGILTGATREETEENIFAVSKGRMNTRSVHILADELFNARKV